jgi:hypothetical protein
MWGFRVFFLTVLETEKFKIEALSSGKELPPTLSHGRRRKRQNQDGL